MSSPYKRFRVMVLGYKAADMTGLIKVYSGGKHTDPNQYRRPAAILTAFPI